MVLTPESVVYILGSFGSAINQGLFTTFGFAFFYLAVMILHMGYVTNMHVFSFKDFKREYQVLAISGVAHLIILMMFASIFSVVQIYFDIANSEVLSGGSGGIIGNAFGQILYSGLGVYGSVLLLLSAAFATSLMAGFYELNDVLATAKDIAVTTKVATFKAARKVNQGVVQSIEFILKDHEMATANVSLSASKSWMSQSINKANSFFTDHFHVNTNFTSFLDRKSDKKETAKKPAVKKATTKSKVSALKTLTVRKSKKKIVATTKKSKKDDLGLSKR